MKKNCYSYDEDKVLEQLKSYIDSTYNAHYVGNGEVQTIDVWHSIGICQEMCQGTALKYLMRYGKKDGYNQKDLLKAMHYIVLLMSFSEKEETQ